MASERAIEERHLFRRKRKAAFAGAPTREERKSWKTIDENSPRDYDKRRAIAEGDIPQSSHSKPTRRM